MGLLNTTTTSDLNSSSIFDGFSNEDICYVPSDIWEIKPRYRSCSIQIHQDSVFDNLQSEVNNSYGPPQCLGNNDNIYRGQVLTYVTGNGVQVIITFYNTTRLVRVQGSGYAMGINKILPTLVNKVVSSDSQPEHNSSTPKYASTPHPMHSTIPVLTSTPISKMSISTFNSGTHVCLLQQGSTSFSPEI